MEFIMKKVPVTITLRESNNQFTADIVNQDGQTITKSFATYREAWDFSDPIRGDAHPEYYLHHENGPAFIGFHEVEEWYRNGKLHRTGGPAIIDYTGGAHSNDLGQKWFFEGKDVSDVVSAAIQWHADGAIPDSFYAN